MELGGSLQRGRAQALALPLPPAGQLGGEERQGGEQQPGVVVDVGLDEAVPVADADGHHRVDGDAVRGEVTGEEGEKKKFSQAFLLFFCFSFIVNSF